MNITSNFVRRLVTISLVSVAVTLLTACATSGIGPEQKLTGEQMKKRAIERSTARWKALTDKRFSEAFAFLSEASKVGLTPAEYEASMKRLGYISSSLESANCDDSICTVKTIVMIPIFVRGVGARPQNVPVEEQWILNNGELWLIRR
jgi:predicted small secreted protein